MRILNNGDAVLSQAERDCLVEALRRRGRHHDNRPHGQESIRKQWTGLGCKGGYKAAVKAGLMEFAVEPKSTVTCPNPHCMGWWRLTELGARIVACWIGRGWTYQRIEAGDFPAPNIPHLIL